MRRPGLSPTDCRAVRESLAEGEPDGFACQDCPVGDPERCPDLDDLSVRALRFGLRFNHPAHEGYQDRLLPYLWPRIGPGEFDGFLARQEVIWEVREEERARRMKEAEEEARRRGRRESGGGGDG